MCLHSFIPIHYLHQFSHANTFSKQCLTVWKCPFAELCLQEEGWAGGEEQKGFWHPVSVGWSVSDAGRMYLLCTGLVPPCPGSWGERAVG